MLPYGTGICCYTFICTVFIASVHSFFNTLFRSGNDKSTEWSTIPACPGLVCFFFFFLNRGSTGGTNSSKQICWMFVCFVLCKFVSGLILWFSENL